MPRKLLLLLFCFTILLVLAWKVIFFLSILILAFTLLDLLGLFDGLKHGKNGGYFRF